jgi:hypothetical protein
MWSGWIGASASAAPIREYTIKKILKNRPAEIFLIFVIAYQGTTHSHQKIHRTFKVRFFVGFYIIRAVRRKRI